MTTRPRKKHGWMEKPVFIGVCAWACFSGGPSRQHKKAERGVAKKNPTRPGGCSSCGTGGGPHGQSQFINLVNGVVTRSLAAPDATRDRVGACGTRLLNGLFIQHHWRAGLQLPFRFAPSSPKPSPRRKIECFSRERVRLRGGWSALDSRRDGTRRSIPPSTRSPVFTPLSPICHLRSRQYWRNE